MDYKIIRYTTEYYTQWNEFVQQSKNGTFLFHRDFMEYHSDRFTDYSLLIFKDEKLTAILPAHIVNNKVFSHYGLTYGGLVYTAKTRLASVLKIFRNILFYLDADNIDNINIKLIPSVYHKFPSDELDYVLFTAGAELIRRDSLFVYDQLNPIPFTKEKKECIRRGGKHNLEIREEPEFALFWNNILMPNLSAKHNIKPVHTVDEIISLYKKFPDNIRHFNVYHNNEIVAGTTVFITDTVAHPQYISGNADKNRLGSLDYLYNYLITGVFKHIRYFDFGISNENQGMKLNGGLALWKETFGARTIVQDFYKVAAKNYTLLDNVLI